MPAKFPYSLQVSVAGTYRVELISPTTGQPVTPAVGISLSMKANATRAGFLTAQLPPGNYAVRASRQGSSASVTAPSALNTCQDCAPVWSSQPTDDLLCIGDQEVVVPTVNGFQASVIII